MPLSFTLAVYIVGWLPSLLAGIGGPPQRFPLAAFLWRDLMFLIDVLPIVALQYALALRFRTFVPPLAIGMAIWVLSIGMVNSRYNVFVPYSYATLDYLRVEYQRPIPGHLPVTAIALALFVVFTGAGYALYAWRRERG
jgi:hypothetical protein